MAGNFTLTWRGPQITAELRQAAGRGVFRALQIHRNEAIRLVLSTTKSGAIYGNHQASAPGEPFASDSGATLQSLRVEYSPGSLSGSVVAGAANAGRMEFGTSRMAPRPFFLPAFSNKRDEMIAAITSEISKGVK